MSGGSPSLIIFSICLLLAINWNLLTAEGPPFWNHWLLTFELKMEQTVVIDFQKGELFSTAFKFFPMWRIFTTPQAHVCQRSPVKEILLCLSPSELYRLSFPIHPSRTGRKDNRILLRDIRRNPSWSPLRPCHKRSAFQHRRTHVPGHLAVCRVCLRSGPPHICRACRSWGQGDQRRSVDIRLHQLEDIDRGCRRATRPARPRPTPIRPIHRCPAVRLRRAQRHLEV